MKGNVKQVGERKGSHKCTSQIQRCLIIQALKHFTFLPKLPISFVVTVVSALQAKCQPLTSQDGYAQRELSLVLPCQEKLLSGFPFNSSLEMSGSDIPPLGGVF